MDIYRGIFPVEGYHIISHQAKNYLTSENSDGVHYFTPKLYFRVIVEVKIYQLPSPRGPEFQLSIF